MFFKSPASSACPRATVDMGIPMGMGSVISSDGLSGLRGGEFVRDVLRDAGLCSLVA